ncbi:OmpA family protein [Pseudohalioglobus lutimaris]|nr:OmpA family protein [Pseudohalioglobus lutimaris]
MFFRSCKYILAAGVLLAIAAQAGNAAIPCADGKRYYDLARKAGAQQDFEKAVQWLDKSVEACDSYAAWHLLGTAYQKQRKLKESLNAYEHAVEHADTTDEAAVSLARYGQVLALNGQRFEALATLDRAIERHSNPPSWMRENARQLDHSLVDTPISGESIKRSLSSQEFGLLSINTVAGRKLADGEAEKTRVRIPINYKLDSTELDAQTSDNIEELGKVLASEDYQGRTFTLVGHTDVRGSWQHNLGLSERRAEAVRDTLVQQYPTLEARLEVKGAGEAKPKYLGEDLPEADHRLNRRLEVYVN